MFNKKALLFFPAIILVCLSLGLVSCQGKTDAPVQGVEKTQVQPAETPSANVAPNFVLKDINGKIVSLSDFKGKVVIVDFWATWCPPCQAEIPHFQALYKENSQKGLVIIGVALDKGGMKVVKPFVEGKGVTYPIVMGTEEVVNRYGGVRGIPTTFIIDRKGYIVEKIVGYRDKSFFESAIKKLL